MDFILNSIDFYNANSNPIFKFRSELMWYKIFLMGEILNKFYFFYAKNIVVASDERHWKLNLFLLSCILYFVFQIEKNAHIYI